MQVERSIDDPIGVAVEPPRIKRCANRCDFCFVEGNPEGSARSSTSGTTITASSFRYGNFATLTNLKQHDIDRIIRYRLAFICLGARHRSAGACAGARNPQAPEIIPQLRHFADHGIEFHTQIVMSPGVNDGAVLKQTLDDLWHFGPAVLSVSVVPVGLTEFSKHHLVREPDEVECRAAVIEVERVGCARHGRAAAKRGRRARTSSTSGRECNCRRPPAYGSLRPGRENGVGSVRWLRSSRCAKGARRCAAGRDGGSRSSPARRWRNSFPMHDRAAH